MPPKGSSKKANVKLAPVKTGRKLKAVQVDDETPLVSSGRGKRLRRNSLDEACSPRDAKGLAHYDLMGDDSLAVDTCMDAVVKVICKSIHISTPQLIAMATTTSSGWQLPDRLNKCIVNLYFYV